MKLKKEIQPLNYNGVWKLVNGRPVDPYIRPFFVPRWVRPSARFIKNKTDLRNVITWLQVVYDNSEDE